MSAQPDDFIKLEIDPLPSADALPAWVATLLAMIGAVVPLPYDVALAAMEALLKPVQPGGMRRADFEALPEATQNVIRQAKDAKLAQMRAARDKARQVIPVVRPGDVAPVSGGEVVATMTLVPRAAEPVAESAQEPASVATGDDAPVNGTWTRIASGPLAGSWGGRVECPSMQVGRLVRLFKRGATRGTLHVVTAFGRRDDAFVCAVRDATDEEIAQLRAPVTGPIPVMTSDTGSGPIESTLTAIAEQSQAAVANERPSTATQDFALAGLRERQAQTPATQLSGQTRSEVRTLLGERDFIAGAVAAGSMLQCSWTGGGETTCGKVDDALMAIGREADAPERKSALAYAGDAVDTMKNRTYDTARLPNNELPDGIKARWIVGRKLSGREINAGDAYGEALCIVSLKDDDTLAFDGDLSIAQGIRSRYAAFTAKQVLKSDTLTAWLGRVLRTRHGAVKRGHVWYVPGGQADAARALIDAISPLWGDHEHIPVTTGPDLFRSLTRGLLSDLRALEKDLYKSTELARTQARSNAEKDAKARYGATEESIAQAVELAGRRATISPTVASRLLRELGEVAAKVAGYHDFVGADSVAPHKALIASLRKTIEPLADDTSARAALLELD